MVQFIIFFATLILALCTWLILRPTSSKNETPAETVASADNEEEIENTAFAPEQKIYDLRADGYGPVTFGMSIEEASKTLSMPLSSNSPEQDEPSCFYVYPFGEPGTVGFMVRDNKIVRVDVHFENPDIKTDRGIKFGSTTADVQKAYENIKIEAHPYGGPDEKYLIYDDQKNHQIIFETDQNGNVTSLRSGRKPEVEFIEGCS